MGCFCLFCATIWPENVLYRPLFEPKHCQNREKKIILSRRARGNPNVIVGPLGGLYWPHNISSIWHSYQTLKMQKSCLKIKKNLRCEFRRVVISPQAETKFNSCSGRQIEDWSWWQSWPFLRALQFCFWDEDLKTNILGWWEFQPVTISPLAETKLRSCSGGSQQNEPWNLLCI